MKDRVYKIARNSDYDGYQRALASMAYKLYDKETKPGNGQLAELHKQVIKKKKNLKTKKIYAGFKDNIWEADLAEILSLSSKNKNVKYLLCDIDVFMTYTWVKPIKDKIGKSVKRWKVKNNHKFLFIV